MAKKVEAHVENRLRFKRPAAGQALTSLANAIATAIHIENTVVDRRAGSTVVEEVCGAETNLSIVAHYMKEPGVREYVSRWFLEHQVVRVIEKNIAANTVSTGEAQATLDGLLRELNGVIDNVGAYNVICEFVIPLARKSGLLNDNTKTTRSVVYPAQTVTISDLTMDLAAQNAVRIAETVNVRMHESGKMSRLAYARSFGEALVTIGYELHRSVNVQHIFDDMVKAVHVRLLSATGSDMIGEIDSRWLNHPLVDEFMRNYTFVSAALALPAGTNLGLKNDINTLEKEAPLAVASLKGSRRYQIVGRDEYLRTYGKKTICNVEGEPVFFIGYRNAALASVAQCVSVFNDAIMPNTAKNVVPGPDGITKFVAASMPRGDAASIDFHVNELITAITHLAESGDPRAFYDGEGGSAYSKYIGEAFFLGDDGESFSDELAALMAEACYLDYQGPEEGVTWLYSTHTKYNRYSDAAWAMCYLPGGEFVTSDKGLFFLVAQDIAPTQSVEPRAQLLSEKALFTRVLDLEERERITERERISFNVKIGNENVNGAIQTNEVGMQELPEEARFVIPVHNKLVMDTISAVHASFDELIKSANEVATTPFGGDEGSELDFSNVAVTPQLVSFLKLARSRAVLKFAQSVPPQYRQIVASVMRMRAVAGKSAAQILRLRGTMQQQSFNAYADVLGLVLILATNGLSNQFIRDLLGDSSMVEAIFLTGSDRIKNHTA